MSWKYPIWWHRENVTWETSYVAKLKRPQVIPGFIPWENSDSSLSLLSFPPQFFFILFLLLHLTSFSRGPSISSFRSPARLPWSLVKWEGTFLFLHLHPSLLTQAPLTIIHLTIPHISPVLLYPFSTLWTIFPPATRVRGQLMRNPSCRVPTLRFSSRSPNSPELSIKYLISTHALHHFPRTVIHPCSCLSRCLPWKYPQQSTMVQGAPLSFPVSPLSTQYLRPLSDPEVRWRGFSPLVSRTNHSGRVTPFHLLISHTSHDQPSSLALSLSLSLSLSSWSLWCWFSYS